MTGQECYKADIFRNKSLAFPEGFTRTATLGRHSRTGPARRPEGHPADAGPLQHRHTADTDTSVLPEAAHRAAQATAEMIIEAARSVPGSRLFRMPRDPHPGRRRCFWLLPDVSFRTGHGQILLAT
jgi:hypothetical protein